MDLSKIVSSTCRDVNQLFKFSKIELKVMGLYFHESVLHPSNPLLIGNKWTILLL